MAKHKSTFVITPENHLGNCPDHPDEVVTIYETISYLPGKVLRAGVCWDCIESLKKSLRKKGAKIVDRRDAALN